MIKGQMIYCDKCEALILDALQMPAARFTKYLACYEDWICCDCSELQKTKLVVDAIQDGNKETINS